MGGAVVATNPTVVGGMTTAGTVAVATGGAVVAGVVVLAGAVDIGAALVEVVVRTRGIVVVSACPALWRVGSEGLAQAAPKL